MLAIGTHLWPSCQRVVNVPTAFVYDCHQLVEASMGKVCLSLLPGFTISKYDGEERKRDIALTNFDASLSLSFLLARTLPQHVRVVEHLIQRSLSLSLSLFFCLFFFIHFITTFSSIAGFRKTPKWKRQLL